MAKDIIARYIWIVDTILTHGRISRDDLNALWVKSQYSGGNPMAERTFYSYRRGIEENFNIDIVCAPDGTYSIESAESSQVRQNIGWILDNSATSTAVASLVSSSGRIEMEDVPSAREFLPIASDAIRDNRKIVFTYAGFTRSRPEVGILFSPYFLKLYKQRWYMFGEKDGGGYRTYALDRVTEMELTPGHFRMPRGLKVGDVFGNIIGITTSKADVREVKIQANYNRSKYLRALPLHHSQTEEVHDFYSIFTYRLKLNYELVSELMAMGPDVVVISPRELQVMLLERLKETLRNYKDM